MRTDGSHWATPGVIPSATQGDQQGRLLSRFFSSSSLGWV